MSSLNEEEIVEDAKQYINNIKELLNEGKNDMTEKENTDFYTLQVVIQGLLDLYNKEKNMYKNTGKIVKNKRDGKVGVVLREFETGQIQVLEKIGDKGGKVINTHDSWKTLEVIEDE